MNAVSPILAFADEHLEVSLARLFDFVRIPSISTDPAYKADCQRAADWIVRELNDMGFEAQARETPKHPMVVAHYAPPGVSKSAPHVLFYGHYDVQPVDPVNLWHAPPFEPQRKKNKKGEDILVGRGTADDKGQLMTFVEAARAWIKSTGSLPIRATFLIEGEEESGSPSLTRKNFPATLPLCVTPTCGMQRRQLLRRGFADWCMRRSQSPARRLIFTLACMAAPHSIPFAHCRNCWRRCMTRMGV
jgi:acetylornithine deacetylase/succinyl-diaminopimelate desuccinylase-like protein